MAGLITPFGAFSERLDGKGVMTRIPLPRDLSQKVADKAVAYARQDLQGRGWSSARSLSPIAQEGQVGIKTSVKYLMYQERGIRPFLMKWVDGRAQTLDAKILTPSGWKLMGDIQVGDQVIDPMGDESWVEGVFPQGEKEIYRVTLSDGSFTEATADHLWSIHIQGLRNPQRLWTTEDIKKHIDQRRISEPSWNYPVRVPQLAPIQYATGDSLPIPSYTLGALLGDGSMGKSIYIHSVDKEILYRIENELPESIRLVHASGLSYRLSKRQGTGKFNQYIQSLNGLGLMGHTCYTKFIPDQYKRASIEDRIALLQGLLDTDGWVSNGQIGFVSTSLQLAQDVGEVVLSLGGRYSLKERKSPIFSRNGNGFTGRISYRLEISIPINVFHLSRKAEKFVPRDNKKFRRIVSIDRIGIKPAQCIKVSAPSQMYVTDNFIPTHNTLPMGCAQGDGPHFRKGGHVGEPGYVDIPHKGKIWRNQRWRHPGIKGNRFMENALKKAIGEIHVELKQDIMAALKGEYRG